MVKKHCLFKGIYRKIKQFGFFKPHFFFKKNQITTHL